jgi:hypothetical protein
MPLLRERRRHPRQALSCPAMLRDKAGRVVLRGRAADVSPCGIRIIGKGGGQLLEGEFVWVELAVPSLKSTGPRTRDVKMRGEVRRVDVMGEWRSVIVVIFETDFSSDMLSPLL